MAALTRQVGGSLDSVMAMTGHKDMKLADHYSCHSEELQKETSLKIMEHIKQFQKSKHAQNLENVLTFEPNLS
ncbi:hypothetical protein BIY24_05395 [Halobacteriovorax marinus]|uniref:hypothetical protein n=1 Tax=Halobacteriovorax marinus TaxID=97084 RepID=UPI000BC2CF73|nr:hypothetical protein [Halobacteriovorax marinus]ATH07392.1 hypothetical protein BIY24_05395 [Halobacteriovorax marinus]